MRCMPKNAGSSTPGPQGITGPTGSSGSTGPTGPTGPLGYRTSKESKGQQVFRGFLVLQDPWGFRELQVLLV